MEITTHTIETSCETIEEFDQIFFFIYGLFDAAKPTTNRIHVICRGQVIGTRWF